MASGKTKLFYGVIFSLLGPLLTLQLRSVHPHHATLSLTNPYSFEISVHVAAQGTNNFSSYPCHLPQVIHNQTLDLQFLSRFPKNVKSQFLVYITNYSLQLLLSSTTESDHPIQAGSVASLCNKSCLHVLARAGNKINVNEFILLVFLTRDGYWS